MRRNYGQPTQLRVFAAVAEARSFAVVADRMELSAAMTSKHVQHLEAEVGARLLNRTSRSVSLTEAGRSTFKQCVLCLKGWMRRERNLRNQHWNRAGP